jgi:ferredoxin-NADP reductase/predicted pyridoxine 5'-phosphate oxidase superfamily flavin-nucleotide-binding protein
MQMPRLPPKPPSPFHQGEVEIQQSLGVAERMAAFGSKVVRDHLTEQHRQFYPRLASVLIGAVDAQGEVWASLLEGSPGFMRAPDPTHLRIDARPAAADPVAAGFVAGAAVGLLGIEWPTRRRNRLNGRLREVDALGGLIEIGHAFGNCPQYIFNRSASLDPAQALNRSGQVDKFAELDAHASALIAGADTFFVASYVDLPHAAEPRQVDISHRAGKPGFVCVDDNVLTIPDYAGNLHFNTLGNLKLNPRVALLFIDFERGDLLQLSGRATLCFDHPLVPHFQGAERIWKVHVLQAVRRRGALALRFAGGDPSPNALLTGSWNDALASRAAAALRSGMRCFRISRAVDEGGDIRSLHLEPQDGMGLPPWQAGQFVSVRVSPPGLSARQRSYTLSSAPSDRSFRISVKRDGLVSRHLHDGLQEGDLIEVGAPSGRFVFDAAERRPAVLISAGAGITPMLAMLRQLVFEGRRTRRFRNVVFVHGARHASTRAFRAEIDALRDAAQGAVSTCWALTRPEPSLQPGRDYQHHGRISVDLLKQILPLDDYDYYLCGPGDFSQSLYDQLRNLRIPDDRIHAEAFGPASLIRTADAASSSGYTPATAPVRVLFSDSGKEARWQPDSGSLLALAESRGLALNFGCRNGSCGSCKVQVAQGAVTYRSPPNAEAGPTEALLCCAEPAAGSNQIELKV